MDVRWCLDFFNKLVSLTGLVARNSILYLYSTIGEHIGKSKKWSIRKEHDFGYFIEILWCDLAN